MHSKKSVVHLTTKGDDKQTLTAKKQLEKLGLTSVQANIYILLAEKGSLRIQEIANLSGTPRTSVYDNLDGLFELGLAEEIIENNFKKIRAYSIGTLRHKFDERISELQNMQLTIEGIEETLNYATQAIADSTSIRYYKGKSGARQVFWNSLKATEPICVYSEWGRSAHVGVRFYERFVEASHQRNIRERVLINARPDTLEQIRANEASPSSLARTRSNDIRIVTAEQLHIQGEVFIYDDIYACIYLRGTEIHGFEIESKAFCDTQRALFETIWHDAAQINAV